MTQIPTDPAGDDDYDDYEGYDDYEEDAFEEALMNCSMGRDGLCGQAGSEYCDFECPFSR